MPVIESDIMHNQNTDDNICAKSEKMSLDETLLCLVNLSE